MALPGKRTYDTWQEIERELLEKNKNEYKELETEEAKQWLTDGLRVAKELPELEKKIRQQFQAVYLLAQEIADMGDISRYPAAQIKIMRLYTDGLNNLMRNHIPQILGFSQEYMDKLVKAMELDRREEARRDPLEGMPYQDYLHTLEWKLRRDQALRDAHNRCQLCNSTKQLDVHHRTYERRGHELPDDLIVLCRNCHSTFHGKLVKEDTI